MPEVLLKFSKKTISELLIKFPRVVPISVFIMVMLTALSVAMSVEQASRSEHLSSATEQTSALGHDLERRASATQAYLISGAALFNSGLTINAQTFGHFVTAIKQDDDYRGILALGWSAVVAPAQGGRPARHAIRFISPQNDQNRAVLGYDMASEPLRRAAMDRAEVSGYPAISGRVTLMRDAGKPGRAGVLIYMPVFEPVAAPQTRGPLRGYVYAALRVEDYVNSALEQQPDKLMAVEIFDGTEAPQNLLYSRGLPIDAANAVTRSVAIADHQWVIRSSTSPASVISRTGMLILVSGLIIASMLTYIVRMALQQAISAREQLAVQREQDAIRISLTRELNHRVKNTLANVLSILALSRREATDLDQFVDTFSGRVRALSATHNLLMQSSWGATWIRAVVDAELAPFYDPKASRVHVAGDDFLVAPNDALSLGLLVHELITNAAKFGALCNAHGRVELTWHKADERHVLFEWRELDGPVVSAQRTRGFGSDLIEKIISRELHSDIKLEFAASGVRCRFLVPLRVVSPFAIKQPAD